MADVIAQEHILFWTAMTSPRGLSVSRVFFSILLGGIHNLPVNRDSATGNSQQNKYYNKNWFCTQPLIQVVADYKTEKDRTCRETAQSRAFPLKPEKGRIHYRRHP